MQSRSMLLAAALNTEPHTAWQWALAIFNIVWIDIVLAGDNAVVIALAVRNLPPKQKRMGIILGAGAAVVLRAVLTVLTTHLLSVSYLKLGGGLLILWIAFKLLRQNDAHGEGEGGGATGIGQAVWMIIVADVTMSLDNVLAVGGAAGGHNALILFGLALSVPLVVFGSNLISRLMVRFPIIVLLGAAILGKVAGEMMLTDPIVAAHGVPWWQGVTGADDGVSAYTWLRYSVEALLFVTIFVYGWFRRGKPGGTASGPPAD
ncbi:MAG: TerC family protein [Opitutaceae bacterium]